jgi:glycosyltransferase involved in cell wall biosynthesis
MRILYLAHQYPPEFIGGVELYTQGVAQSFAQHGWKVAVFHRSYAPKSLCEVNQQGDLTVYKLASGSPSPIGRFLATWRLSGSLNFWRKAIDEFQPDLVHVQHLLGLPTSLLEHLHRVGIPYLITLWDYWWVCANANLLTNYAQSACSGPKAFLNCTHCAVARLGKRPAWLLTPLLVGLFVDRNRRLEQLLKRASALVAPSEFVWRWYKQRGIPEHLLITVKPGAIPPAQLNSMHQSGGDHLRVLYVGGIAANKGVHTLIEALRWVEGNIRLYIAGNLSTHPQYASKLRQLADHRVTFIGELNRHGVWQAMMNADIVAVPSLWHETFCFVAHEALAAGTPVLASATGALPETIQNGVNGFLLPPGDVIAWRKALQNLVDHPDTLRAMRPKKSMPTFEEHVKQLALVYRAVLERYNRCNNA